jgi:hypothetical protein
MRAENIESKSESVDNQPLQESKQLLDSFLNLTDFRNAFKQTQKDALPGFPSGDEMILAQAGPESESDSRAAHIKARPTRVADRGDDTKAEKRGQDSVEKKPVVEKNTQGDVSKVTYPNGETKEFEYDAKHHLTKIKYKNGDYYEKDKNDNWNLHSKHATDSLGQANIRVEKDGTLVFHSQDGNRTMITRPDGRIGSVEREQGQQVKKVDYPGGDSKQFEHDKDGLSKVTEKNGNTWQKDSDGSWNQYDKKGTATGGKMGKIDIDELGDLTMTSVDGKSETLILPNGTIYRKANGRVTNIERK